MLPSADNQTDRHLNPCVNLEATLSAGVEKEAKTYQFTHLTTEPHGNGQGRGGKGAHGHCPPLPASTSKPELSESSDAQNTLIPALPAVHRAPGDAASPHSAAERRTRNRFSYLVAASSSSCCCLGFSCCCRGGGAVAELLVSPSGG